MLLYTKDKVIYIMGLIQFRLRSGALQKLMQKRMISISELSRSSGVSRPALYSLINENVKYVRISTCRKVAEALNVDVGTLFEVATDTNTEVEDNE